MTCSYLLAKCRQYNDVLAILENMNVHVVNVDSRPDGYQGSEQASEHTEFRERGKGNWVLANWSLQGRVGLDMEVVRHKFSRRQAAHAVIPFKHLLCLGVCRLHHFHVQNFSKPPC